MIVRYKHIKYCIINRMNQAISLSPAERARMENEKQLYVLLKLINFTEKYYSYDKIDAGTYKSEITKYIEKYNRFSQVIPNFKLDNFLKKYSVSVDEVSWAKLVLEKGVHTEENRLNQNFLFMQSASKFIEVFECLNLNSDDPNIGSIKNPLEQLYMILKKINTKLGPNFTQKFQEYQKMLQNYVTSKSINESLTASEFKEINVHLEGMYRMMEIIMKN